MKEQYLRPAVINADTLEGNGVLPILQAIAGAAAAGYALGKSLKSVFGVFHPVEKISTLTTRKNFELI